MLVWAAANRDPEQLPGARPLRPRPLAERRTSPSAAASTAASGSTSRGSSCASRSRSCSRGRSGSSSRASRCARRSSAWRLVLPVRFREIIVDLVCRSTPSAPSRAGRFRIDDGELVRPSHPEQERRSRAVDACPTSRSSSSRNDHAARLRSAAPEASTASTAIPGCARPVAERRLERLLGAPPLRRRPGRGAATRRSSRPRCRTSCRSSPSPAGARRSTSTRPSTRRTGAR